MSQATVHSPFFEIIARGETSHGWPPVLARETAALAPESSPMTRTEASDGRLRSTPFHTYRRPGGGEDGCSDRPVIRTTGEFNSDPFAEAFGDGDPLVLTVGDGGFCGWPLDRLITATTMAPRAAATAASSTCHRSSRRHRLLAYRFPMGRFSHVRRDSALHSLVTPTPLLIIVTCRRRT